MKHLLFLVVFLGTFANMGAAGEIQLTDLCRGVYGAQNVYGVNPLMDGESYSQMKDGGKKIVRVSFRTGEETEVIFDADNIKTRIELPHIEGYIMSPNEQNILLRTQTKNIYRHSRTSQYYIYNVKNRTVAKLSDGGPQEVPLWSRDGNMVAFVREGNLFLVKLLFNNSESQITKDGKFNEVINGKPDWVNEEEFSFNRAFDFNEDNTMIAWIRYDEKDVPMFSFPWYKGLKPERNEYAEYPGSYDYKYPIAGAKNSVVSVHSFDIKSRVIRKMQLPIPEDGYVPRIFFTKDPEKLLILTNNRHQDCMDIYLANPRSTECRVIVREQAEKYIPEDVYKNFKVLDDGFVLMSERSGFNHLYLYDLTGTMRRQLTKGNFVVTDFYGYDAKSGATYYASTEESPLCRTVYKSDAKGKVTKLSQERGTNKAIFSRGLRFYMNVYSNINTPPVTTLCDANGKMLKMLIDNAELKQKLAGLSLGERKFFTFKTQDGVELNGYMVLPSNFSQSKKYPVKLSGNQSLTTNKTPISIAHTIVNKPNANIFLIILVNN